MLDFTEQEYGPTLKEFLVERGRDYLGTIVKERLDDEYTFHPQIDVEINKDEMERIAEEMEVLNAEDIHKRRL